DILERVRVHFAVELPEETLQGLRPMGDRDHLDIRLAEPLREDVSDLGAELLIVQPLLDESPNRLRALLPEVAGRSWGGGFGSSLLRLRGVPPSGAALSHSRPLALTYQLT